MRDARITFDWVDGTYSFRLAWKELAELQEKCDAGPWVILNRLQSGHWRIEDVSNVIRLGLIGGGIAPSDALSKVRKWVEDRPPMENHPFAIAILSAGLLGVDDEPVGEQGAADQTDSSSTIFPTGS
jgi:hypothetical protein